MIKTLCVGQASYDIYVQVDEFIKENDKMRFINKLGCGSGSAENVAYLLAKWGVSSTFAGVVGNDVFGNRVKKELQSVGVDIRFVETSYEKDTPISFVIVNTKGSRTVLNVADEYVKLKKFDFDFQPDLIMIDGHDPYASKTVLEHFPKAISIIDADRYNQDIVNLCLKSNYMICSLNFACQATKMTVDLKNVQSLVNLYDDLRKRFEHQTIIVTLKDYGALYMVDNQIKISPSIKTQLVDKTSSGDVFAGAFCYGVASGFPLEQTIKYANIAAGLSVTKLSIKESIPKLDEVKSIYEKNN